jgi:hypothetical protein
LLWGKSSRLRDHATCFSFDEYGAESAQLDIIVATDTAPRFDLHKRSGKSFCPVEGALGAFSVKSILNKSELHNALAGVASIPPTMPLGSRRPLMLNISNYDDWPLKVVYASTGIAPSTLFGHLRDFYADHPEIALIRRPNFIHVAGSCFIARQTAGMVLRNSAGAAAPAEIGEYRMVTTDADIQAIVWTLHELQSRASASTHVLFSYAELMNKVIGLPPDPAPPLVQSIDVFTTWEGIE